MHRISKGLDLPIAGRPEQVVSDAAPVRSVALLGCDYVGMKPTLTVAEGDRVRAGQTVFTDKKTEGVAFTAPASGVVSSIVRGEKRRFDALVIDVDGDGNDAVEFDVPQNADFGTLDPADVRRILAESGQWTAFRTRPYSKVPSPSSTPHSLFVTAIDTHPLAVDPAVVLNEHADAFERGLQVVGRLTDGSVHLCKKMGESVPGQDLAGISPADFEGPHPAGLPGTHIHMLDPVGDRKTVWHIGYQDVIAIGHLFATGRLFTERTISLAGPSVEKPRLLRTRLGAAVGDLVAGELTDDENRIVSGSVLGGRTAVDPNAYLGRYHLQLSVLPEGRQREFLGWQKPGFGKFSVKRLFAAAWFGRRSFPMTTNMGGSRRAMVPIGSYEQVLPLDVEPTFLLRSLIVRDTEQAQLLGALELDEEDLSLCTFVCPGKYDYGPILRDNLLRIEKEG